MITRLKTGIGLSGEMGNGKYIDMYSKRFTYNYIKIRLLNLLNI